jgi:tRNA(Ile)-lysidine synthase
VAVLPPFVRKIGRQLRRLGVGQEGIVVAVSGGPDSIALLRALAAPRRGENLYVAHLNHQLRGPESDADEKFVRQLHSQLAANGQISTSFYTKRIDVAELARTQRENLESVARHARYAWLASVAAETGARWVATGHTADDQAETVLHRLLRGAGLKGLRGIAARRRLADGIEIVRPMLGLRRTDVMAFLAAIGQPYRVDSSNRDPRFTRNRIRHELLPLLAERFNPKIVAVLQRLADQAEEAYQTQVRRARALLRACERPRAGSVLIFDRKPMADAPRSVVREVFRLVWEREGWPTGRMGFDAWDRLAGLALGEASGVDLPGGIRARAGERVAQIEPPP